MKFVVGDWLINYATNTITHQENAEEKTLQPRSLSLLLYLAENAEKVVSLQEITANVWNGRVVTDHAIYQTINKLRKELDADKNAYIKTVQKKGYQLVRPVEFIKTNATTSIDTDSGINESGVITENLKTIKILSLLFASVLGAYILWSQWLGPKIAYDNIPFYSKVTPLVTLKGYEADPVFTKDGKSLIFSHKENLDAPYNLYLQNLSDGSITQLTDSKQDDLRATTSKDGRKILFVSLTDSSCSVKQLLLEPTQSDYSESEIFNCMENRLIDIDITNSGDTLYYTFLNKENRTARIYSMLLSTKKITELTNYKVHNAWGDRNIALSPDETKIAFLRNDHDEETMLYTYDLNALKETKHFERIGWIEKLEWRDQNNILFLPKNKNLFNYSFPLKREKEILIELTETILGFTYSAHEKAIATTTGKFNDYIWESVLNDDGPDESTSFIVSDGINTMPRFSNKDSNMIAFVSDQTGSEQIWLFVNGKKRRISNFNDQRNISGLIWHPSDQYLVALYKNDYIYKIDIETGSEDVIIQATKPETYVGYHTFSKNGEFMYYTSNDNAKNDFEIYKLNLKNGVTDQITQNSGAKLFEHPSDDKQLFILKSYQKGLWQLGLDDPYHEEQLISDTNIFRRNKVHIFEDGIYYSPDYSPLDGNLNQASHNKRLSFYSFEDEKITKHLDFDRTLGDYDIDEQTQRILFSHSVRDETSINLLKE